MKRRAPSVRAAESYLRRNGLTLEVWFGAARDEGGGVKKRCWWAKLCGKDKACVTATGSSFVAALAAAVAQFEAL